MKAVFGDVETVVHNMFNISLILSLSRIYNEYIAHKEHVHMNSTRWETLTGFVMYLGKTGKCKVDQTEEGWFIAWIDRDPETIARQVIDIIQDSLKAEKSS